MGSEVPGCIDIHSDRPEVGADHGDMEDRPEVAGINNPGCFAHRTVEEEYVTDHESQARLRSECHEFI